VIKDQDTLYEYDGDGRLVRKTENFGSANPRLWLFKWNPMGLLAEVVSPAGETWRYTYDALGRRIRKRGPATNLVYVWDGNAVLHEVPANNAAEAVTWFFWPDDFVPIARQARGKTSLAVNDHLGTPRELVNEEGEIVWSARFSVWGDLEALPVSTVDNLLRFQGQWFDPETGLHYTGCRYYSPEQKAFISMDPVPLAGGPNGYQYVLNPLNWIDPHGLAAQPLPLDSQGRPTGASGTLTRRDLRPTDSSPPTIDPPGWQGGAHPHHQQRSHLVADTLGGSGSDPRNIVALTDGSNHPGMSTVEGTVRRQIEQHGGPVHYEVEVHYRDNHRTPSSVHIRATDKHGNVIVDERIANGRRQKTSCCP
jgi:RHS repeat-associated protein